jgi:hypothetical protein
MNNNHQVANHKHAVENWEVDGAKITLQLFANILTVDDVFLRFIGRRMKGIEQFCVRVSQPDTY